MAFSIGMVSISFFSNGQALTFQTWNTTNTGNVFTVNAFSSITVDKAGRIWAGSTLGGLYYYQGNNWTKAAIYSDITFRDLMPSNIAGDSSIWCASLGNLDSATTGGVFYIKPTGINLNGNSFQITRYGTGSFGGLSSRLASSLAMNNGYVYVGLNRQGTTTEGGVYRMSMSNPVLPTASSFSKVNIDIGAGISYQSIGTRTRTTWFARDNYCSGTCAAGRIFRYDISGAFLVPVTVNNSPIPFSTNPGAPNVRAIFTDTVTNYTYVGLSNGGGIAVQKQDSTWKLLTAINSPLPANTIVNFNAITRVFGEIWIGTNKGIFVYTGCGPLDSASSFKMLTTLNGLPNNNITDIVVDTARSQIWLTSPSGVSRCDYTNKPPVIEGFLQNVSCTISAVEKDKAPSLYSGLDMTPITQNVVIRLTENGVLKEMTKIIDDNGRFEVTAVQPNHLYDLEIVYQSIHGPIKYTYNNLKQCTFLGVIPFPEKLISEIKAFKPNMAKRDFGKELPFKLALPFESYGFDVGNYEHAWDAFLSAGGIRDSLQKRVDNLADYYCAMATVYKLGGDATELYYQAASIGFDFLEAIVGDIIPTEELKNAGPYEDLKNEFFLAMAENVKDLAIVGLKKMKKYVTDPDILRYIKVTTELVNDLGDAMIKTAEKGIGAGVGKLSYDFFKMGAAALAANSYFYKPYCQETHAGFVSTASSSAYNFQSPQAYDLTFNKLYSTSAGSISKQSGDIFTTTKNNTTNAKSDSKLADYTATITDLASKVVLVTGVFTPLAPVLKGVSNFASVVSLVYLFTASAENYLNAKNIRTISQNILPSAMLNTPNPVEVMGISNGVSANFSITDLLNSKTIYNQRLTELKAIYGIPAYDSASLFAKLNQLGNADSIYSSQLDITINQLWSVADSAIIKIPNFQTRLDVVIDSFVSKQYTHRNAFFYKNLAYIADTAKSIYTNNLSMLADSIIILNDSAVLGLGKLFDSVASNNILSQAYLVNDNYVMNHSHLFGDTGSVSYTFKNYGAEAQQNVRFKIEAPTSGFSITSADSIFVGTINPGESKTISFSFSTPFHDSVSTYHIKTYAANGFFDDVSGVLFAYDTTKFYTVVNGDWSSPSTWNREMVPAANSVVEVNHKIVVDVDATCKSLKNSFYGEITLRPGKNLIITH